MELLRGLTTVLGILAMLGLESEGTAVTVGVSDVTDTTATVTVSSPTAFKMGAMLTADPPAGVTFDPAAQPSTAETSFEFAVTGLTSGTQYTFTAGTLTDASDSPLTPASEDSPATCTKPAPVTALEVSASAEDEITLSWTNPSADPAKITVMFGDEYSVDLDDPTEEMYVVTKSDADTLLTAGTSGKCKVATGLTSGDCTAETNVVEIDCSTKSSSTEIFMSKLVMLFVVWGVFGNRD